MLKRGITLIPIDAAGCASLIACVKCVLYRLYSVLLCANVPHVLMPQCGAKNIVGSMRCKVVIAELQ